MLIIKSLDQPDQVRASSSQDQHMEDLMRASPNIKGSWTIFFWYPHLWNLISTKLAIQGQ